MQHDIVTVTKEVEKLKQREAEIGKDCTTTTSKIADDQRYQGELQLRQQNLTSEMLQLMERGPSQEGSTNVGQLEAKVKLLEGQVMEVQGENRQLQSKFDTTTTKVNSFITEMNSFLDVHHIQPLLMDVESGGIEYEDDEEDDMVDDEEDGGITMMQQQL